MMRAVFLFWVLVMFVTTGESQHPAFYGIGTQLGRILPHSSELRPLTNNPIWGAGFEISKMKLDQKSWNQCNCFSKVGASFEYFNFQNSNLGSSYNLVLFAEPLLTLKEPFYYSLRVGTGFSYVSQVFDEQTNPQNTFFSSHLSFIMLVGLKFNYRVSDYYTVYTNVSYNHISNGGSKQPNKGMNFPTVGIGVSYNPQQYQLERGATNQELKGTLRPYFRLFGTLPEVGGQVEEDVNERRLLLGLSGGVLYHLTHTNAFNLGLELVNNQAYKARFDREGSNENHRTLGIVVGHNFVFGRLMFNQQLGWYAYKDHSAVDTSIFQRYELLYSLTKNLQLGTSLKSHGHVAENLDIRIGYLF